MSLRRFVILLVGLTPLVDAMNGYLTIYQGGSLTALFSIYRILLIIIITVCLSRQAPRIFLIFIGVSLVLLLNLLIQAAILNSISDVIYDSFTYLIKFLSFLVSASYLGVLVKGREQEVEQDILVSIRIFAYSMPILIVVPWLLGTGRLTYAGSGYGQSGFFIANNTSNFALIISVLVLAEFILKQNYRFKFFDSLFFILGLFSLYLQGTKAGYAVIVMVFLLVIGTEAKKIIRKLNLIGIFAIALSIFICVVLILVWLGVLVPLREAFLENMNIFFQRQSYLRSLNGTVTGALTSGRLNFVQQAIGYLSNEQNIFLWLTGVGHGFLTMVIGHATEMDPIDLYFCFGFLGPIICYAGVVFLTKTSLHKSTPLLSRVFIIVAIIFSIIVGHVFMEVLSSTAFILLIMQAEILSAPKSMSDEK